MSQNKRRTTGLPSANKKNAPGSATSGTGPEVQSRAELEALWVKRLVWAASAVLGIVVLIIFAILLYNVAIVPGSVVADVNGTTITAQEFRDRYQFERAQVTQQLQSLEQQADLFGMEFEQLLQQAPYSTLWAEYNSPDQLGQRVIDEMVEDVLIAQGATEAQIAVDDEMVETRIQDFFGFDPTQVASIGLEGTATPDPTATPTPFVSPTPSPTAIASPTVSLTATASADATQTPTVVPSPTQSQDEAIAQHAIRVMNYRSNLEAYPGVTSASIDAFFQRETLRDAFSKHLAGSTENILYADVRHILVDTEERALEIIAALENGESFAELAAAVSTDTGSGARGGELGMAPVSNYVDEFAEAVTNALIGEIVGPVESTFGFHVLQVRSREEREASENEQSSLRSGALQRWLDDTRTSEATNIQVFDWVSYLP
jgi:parvulin-like peptidyl-prolyl isomerase